MTVALRYLSFDVSEDAFGVVNCDAMACVLGPHVPHVEAEIQQVLRWAQDSFPGTQGPLDEGGEWDMDMQSQPEPVTGTVDGCARTTITLSITGTAQFAQAFAEQFSWD